MKIELTMKGSPYMKGLRDDCVLQCEKYIQMAMDLQPDIEKIYSAMTISKEEYALNCQYMHRGYYCPSLIKEHYINNVSRGRILKRMAKATRPTYHYLFDEDHKLRLAEEFLEKGTIKCEYIFHLDNISYGIIYPNTTIGRQGNISISKYEEGRLHSYIWAYWWPRAGEIYFYTIEQELYHYSGDGKLIADVYEFSDQTGHYQKWQFDIGNQCDIVKGSEKLLISEMLALSEKEGLVTITVGY